MRPQASSNVLHSGENALEHVVYVTTFHLLGPHKWQKIENYKNVQNIITNTMDAYHINDYFVNYFYIIYKIMWYDQIYFL